MQPRSLQERIEKNSQVDDSGCWIWQLGVSSQGYGQAWLTTGYNQGMNTSAHRVSYIAFKGNIADGLQIDHLCKVRSCVNPEHLEAVTPKENVRRSDAFSKVLKARTNCPKGHEYTEENTFVAKRSNGWVTRACKTCDYARHKLQRDKKRMLVHAA